MREYREVGRQSWKNGFNDTEREKEYVEMKRCPRKESFADGSVGARVKSKQKNMRCLNVTVIEKSE